MQGHSSRGLTTHVIHTPRTWGPTGVGKLFTSTPDWRFGLEGEQFTLVVQGKTMTESVLVLANLTVKPGAIWATLCFTGNKGQRLSLDGIPNNDAKELLQAIQSAIEGIKYRARVAELLRDFRTAIGPVLTWASQMVRATKTQLRMKGWLTGEFIQRQVQSKPNGLGGLLSTPEVVKHLESEAPQIQEAVKLWERNFQAFADSVNERHLTKQLTDFKRFFDTVEKSPLTQEQAKAVVCFDNRVLLVASAGSGKTSTMVAKAGYALKNGYFQPERMLLLAFNNDAAKELGQRIKERLEPLGLPAEKVAAKTFHAFGLDVIGQATGKRPSLAPWVESGKDLEHLLEIVDALKDKDSSFRTNWDLFRIVLGQDLPKFGKEQESPDSWDRNTREEGFWTLNNEVVKSRGEQMIANWLFYNGVNYVYEAAYEIETADAQHRQYRPDFYITDAKAYLEHWALDDKGEPPPEFVGYKQGMLWKKQLHATHGTKLLETTMADLWSGTAFRYLETEIQKLGVTLDPDPDRPAPGRKPIENPRLARTFRSFMTHAKSNRLPLQDLRSRLHAGVAGNFRFRHKVFLDLFEMVWAEWEARLKQSNCIDFEDMLNLATDCVEQGKWKSPYELVMVDEFQDASQARARLVAGLVSGPDKHLFAVGDDWQSINRFAGADLAVMTDFEQRFGPAVTLKLQTTFRCPQTLCNISSTFVQKNPKQLRKAVRSSQPHIQDPVSIVRVEDEFQIRMAVGKRLEEIARTASQGRKQKVLLLGRYQKDRDYFPQSYDKERLEVEFITVHSSKGLEGDHVILPRMTSETLGFPSRIADDPVLQLAMPGGDAFEYAEERRLFYVALTRARSTVSLITLAHKESPFITELVKEHQIEVHNADGSVSCDELCPSCGKGFLVQRKGKYGQFMGCSSFPKCKHTHNLK
ncbi:MAG: UvrD-helicase domain-containing protein [Rhodoferax sp.]|uniref:UvrD-helicase domain-containing protein n=1 Tax=Rhodoferax sp. TaxID=50421 RepID=UPI00181C0F3B|nr:UvrD-helicase domain-containing protein [Rhodoferax sp.]NMM20960.1 UvrD-helicase domain-containing protein [Rhodoferax sp.]